LHLIKFEVILAIRMKNYFHPMNYDRNTIMTYTYLTAQQLAEKIQYDARTIRNQLKDSVFIEGVHYIRPFGGRKILFVWERIETEMLKFTGLSMDALQ